MNPRSISTIASVSLVALAMLAAPSASLAQSADPSGTYLTQKGDARVKVSRCGGAICGVVVWLRDKIDPMTGQPQRDDKNPNPALRNRPIVGLPLFIDMRPSGPNRWSGQIYNADDGSTYVSHVSVNGQDTLQVDGCVGAICGGEVWTRVGR